MPNGKYLRIAVLANGTICGMQSQFWRFMHGLDHIHTAHWVWSSLGGSGLIVLATGIFQRLNRPQVDWLILGVVFLASLVMLLVASRRSGTTPPAKGRLAVHSAVYGTGPVNDVDVTETVRSFIGSGLVMQIENNTLKTDPIQGVPKRLRVDYSYGTYRSAIERPEHDLMVLPEDSHLNGTIAKLSQKLADAENEIRRNREALHGNT